jgi:hypothetical protein
MEKRTGAAKKKKKRGFFIERFSELMISRMETKAIASKMTRISSAICFGQCGCETRGVMFVMSDPRNVAHNKKVTQEKQHKHAETAPAAKRAAREKKKAAGDEGKERGESAQAPEAPKVEQRPGDLEKSVAILSKLKEMEFHSRGNIEALAQLTLTIEEELKQREFSEPIGAVYSAQDAFHAKIATLIEAYEAKCEQLKGPA